MEKTKKDENNLSVDDIFQFMELYYDRSGIMFSHLYNSFNKFLDEDVKIFLENIEKDHSFYDKITKDKVIKNKFKYENVTIKPPMLDNDIEPMFPSDARGRSLTYGGKILAKVTQIQEITDIATNKTTTRIIGNPEENVPISNIPIMIRSQYCSENLYKGHVKSGSKYDPGGYFIINGSEKVIISQDRMCENKPLVFIKKDSGSKTYVVQVNSKSYRPRGLVQIISIKMKKDNILTIKVPILNEVPVFIIFRALGIESDYDIINYVSYDTTDFDMINTIRLSLDACVNDKGERIQTQDEALEYLSSKMRVIKRYSETDKALRNQQKKLHLLNLFETGFLPHIEGNTKQKGIYLGYMINRLLKCYLNRAPIDDRDSYKNKRIDLPGNLIEELFRQYYRKMLNECNKFFKKRNQSDENPINIINQIKPNTIEQGLKTALSTGSWIRRKGVAQVLQRLSYLLTLSLLRRIDAPGGDAATSKLTGPRHLHPSSVRWMCCLTGDTEVLMSDNASVKLIKNIKNGDNVISVYKEKLDECSSKVQNYFKAKEEKILKITTITGREVKCTYDHKLLVKNKNKYEFKKAETLKEGDILIARNMQKYLPYEKETNIILNSDEINKQYKSDLAELGFLDKPLSQEKLEITARLIGYNITNGHIQNKGQYNCEFFVREENDAFEILNDLVKLGFGTPTINQKIITNKCIKTENKNTFSVTKNGVFGYYLFKMGALIGNKNIPEWIINGNKRIKREFLSGFQGGNNFEIKMQKDKDKENYTLFIESIYQESSSEYLELIRKLFLEFSIESKVITKKILNDNNKSNIQLEIKFSDSYENIIKYADYIGHRYCNEKRRKLALPIEYIKYKKYMMDVNKQKNEFKYIKYDEFIKYYIKNDKLQSPIYKIEELPPEPVYDFETNTDAHSFLVNGIVSSNCVQTPEGQKVGLTKNLSMIGNITILQTSQLALIKLFLKDKLINVQDISSNKIKNLTKVFLCGEWLGLSKTPFKLEKELRIKKIK